MARIKNMEAQASQVRPSGWVPSSHSAHLPGLCVQVLAKRRGHRDEYDRVSGLRGTSGMSAEDGTLFCKPLCVLLWSFVVDLR